MNLVLGVVAILFVLWVLGFTLHVGGSLIHLLLLAAVIAVVVQLFSSWTRPT